MCGAPAQRRRKDTPCVTQQGLEWQLASASCSALRSPGRRTRKSKSHLGGGCTTPNSDVSDHLGNGYNFNFGVQVNVKPAIGIEGLYSFNGLGEKRISIPVSGNPGGDSAVPTDFFGTHEHAVRHGERRLSEAGRAASGRTASSGWASTIARSRSRRRGWAMCRVLRSVVVRLLPGGFVPVDNIVGERSSTDFGMDFGGGVKFGAIYAELRYHYIWGPNVRKARRFNPLPGTTVSADRKANGQFLATTFGIRF